jgi:NAD(P)-dependent dehydrogenase (short-subunit alcohol dehydrogenase family)
MQDFRGKVAVITGAASGIGRGMAETFVSVGMRVLLSDIEEKALAATAAELRNAGADVHPVVTDVSDPSAVEALAEAAIARYRAVHVLCNNAGVHTPTIPIWSTTLDDWTWLLRVNVMGAVHGIRTFLPIMIDQGDEAHVVNTSSISGLTTGSSIYSTTKSAIVSLSEALYVHLVEGGLKPRVSVLCPGMVNTNIFNSERNRPNSLAHASPIPEYWSTEAAREVFKLGLSPRRVGEQVLQAIRDQRFYVLTHPDHTAEVEQRGQRISRGENPVRAVRQ